jgi:hypothetical protein
MMDDDTAFGVDRYGNVHVLIYEDIGMKRGRSEGRAVGESERE